MCGNNAVVELVGFTLAFAEYFFEAAVEWIALRWRNSEIRKPQSNRSCFARTDRKRIVRCSLGSDLISIHGVSCAVNDEFVDPVLGVSCTVVVIVKPPRVGLVVREKQLGESLTKQ